MFRPVAYEIKREGSIVRLYANDKVKVELFVDATDNRITIQSIHGKLNSNDIYNLTQHLDENYGAKQILIVPEELQKYFKRYGYSSDTTQSQSTARFRQVYAENLANIPTENVNPDFNFISGDDVRNCDPQHIESLMKNSKFLASKIEQYQMQGSEGFQLMCKYSEPYGIRDGNGKLIAFCRVTKLSDGNAYLGDTFVDESAFGNKQKGTALLYNRVGKSLDPATRLLLIAPPEREAEFDAYGCTRPNDVMLKFGGPMPALKEVFESEIAKKNSIFLGCR